MYGFSKCRSGQPGPASLQSRTALIAPQASFSVNFRPKVVSQLLFLTKKLEQKAVLNFYFSISKDPSFTVRLSVSESLRTFYMI